MRKTTCDFATSTSPEYELYGVVEDVGDAANCMSLVSDVKKAWGHGMVAGATYLEFNDQCTPYGMGEASMALSFLKSCGRCLTWKT